MTTLYLIRHAEAEGNAYRRIDGWYNSLITPNGLLQIEAPAAALNRSRSTPVMPATSIAPARPPRPSMSRKHSSCTPTRACARSVSAAGKTIPSASWSSSSRRCLNNSTTTPSTGTSRAVRRGRSLPRVLRRRCATLPPRMPAKRLPSSRTAPCSAHFSSGCSAAGMCRIVIIPPSPA